MKKISIIGSFILVIIIIGIIFINGAQRDTQVTKEKTKVGVLFNGECKDKSWGQSHYDGLEITARQLNLDLQYVENTPETEECLAIIDGLIMDGCEIIICNSFNYGEWMIQAAEKYPDICFFHATGVVDSKNLTTYFGRIYQMRYLSGIVAGMQTETNQIGYVAAFPISEVNRGINAFTLGVRSVNPEATVYVEWSETWTDDERTAKAATDLLDKNTRIDVLAMHTDSLAVLDIAQERGIWSIGYNYDNSKLYPDTYLTAPVWDWDNFYIPRLLECLQGKFKGDNYWEGVEEDIISLAPLTDNVKAGIADVVEKELGRIKSGEFDVFYGPVKDQDGNIRVEEGENMSDEVLLNCFDWYVEGVAFYE